ncbi:preprotein translocase subunit YajC [Chloroflexota bacterium]
MRKLTLLAAMLLSFPIFGSSCIPASPGGTEQQGFDWTIIVFLALIFAVFYFLMIRPQRKRQKEHESMMQELQKGDKVITSGGIYGTVESLNDDSVVLKIEGGSTIRVARNAVAGRRQK